MKKILSALLFIGVCFGLSSILTRGKEPIGENYKNIIKVKTTIVAHISLLRRGEMIVLLDDNQNSYQIELAALGLNQFSKDDKKKEIVVEYYQLKKEKCLKSLTFDNKTTMNKTFDIDCYNID